MRVRTPGSGTQHSKQYAPYTLDCDNETSPFGRYFLFCFPPPPTFRGKISPMKSTQRHTCSPDKPKNIPLSLAPVHSITTKGSLASCCARIELVQESIVSISLVCVSNCGALLSPPHKQGDLPTSLPFPLNANAQSYSPFALKPKPFQTTEPLGAR